NLWAEARDAGFLVEHPDGGPYMIDQGQFDASLVDLTEPAAQDWMATVIAEEVLAHGVDGFMADFGEALPMDAVLHDGDAATVHNAYPRLWAQTVRQGCEQAGRPDCVTWFRAGTHGMASQTPAFWNGDQMVTWSADDGMASSLLGTLSAGVSGWPVVHSDIGGYTSIDAVSRTTSAARNSWHGGASTLRSVPCSAVMRATGPRRTGRSTTPTRSRPSPATAGSSRRWHRIARRCWPRRWRPGCR